MTNNKFVISIAGNTTIHYDTETRLVSTKGTFAFNRSTCFNTAEAAEKYAQSLIDGLKNNPSISKQELQYVTSKRFSIIDFDKNLCVNCKESRVHSNMNRCLRCSYM